MVVFSLIIPTLNEERHLPRLLQSLGPRDTMEVIVVDGGSVDRTPVLAQEAGVRVVTSARGRGRQMNAGAAAAQGEVLWFLHADVQPPADAREQMLGALQDGAVLGGGVPDAQ